MLNALMCYSLHPQIIHVESIEGTGVKLEARGRHLAHHVIFLLPVIENRLVNLHDAC